LNILPLSQSLYPSILNEIGNKSNLLAYYKKDHRFSLPKSELNLRIYFQG
jgi:hypothetical protein